MNKSTEEMESRGFSSTVFKASDAAIYGLVTELKSKISAELTQIKEARTHIMPLLLMMQMLLATHGTRHSIMRLTM